MPATLRCCRCDVFLVVLLLGLTKEAVGKVQSSSAPVALILQLSDLHISRFHQGSRLEDLEALSQQVRLYTFL